MDLDLLVVFFLLGVQLGEYLAFQALAKAIVVRPNDQDD
jgi:hypothetical protein